MSSNRIEVRLRPAQESDTAGMLELTRTIWDGHDYVPEVWADWLADPEGQLTVAELDGRVVGLSKLTRLAPGSWWLEGLRVDPQFQGQGIAARLHDNMLNLWERLGGETLRLVTSSKRYPVHHLCERSGFRKVGEFATFLAPALPAGQVPFTLIRPEESEEAFRWAQSSPVAGWTAGLVDIDWTWMEPEEAHIRGAVQAGSGWWWSPGGGAGQEGLALVHIDENEEKEKFLNLQLLALAEKDAATCLHDFRRLAGKLGCQQATWTPALGTDAELALRSAGYERAYEHCVFVYEKKRQG